MRDFAERHPHSEVCLISKIWEEESQYIGGWRGGQNPLPFLPSQEPAVTGEEARGNPRRMPDMAKAAHHHGSFRTRSQMIPVRRKGLPGENEGSKGIKREKR